MYSCADPRIGDATDNGIVSRGTPSFPLEPVEDPRYSGTRVGEREPGPVDLSLETYRYPTGSYNSIEVNEGSSVFRQYSGF